MTLQGKIIGELFRISSATVEGFTERLQGTEGFIENDFLDAYRLHIVMKQRIARAAKVFLINNWTKVGDWTMLEIVIRDNSKKKTHYYNHVPKAKKERSTPKKQGTTNEEWSITDKLLSKVDADRAKKHNPVLSLSEMVLDPTDEDFSITINGVDHNCIDDDSVIILADYAENWLKARNEEPVQQS